MFKVLQNLFTLRHMEIELRDSAAQNKVLQLENAEMREVIAVKDKEIRRLQEDLDSCRKARGMRPIHYPAGWMG